MISLLGFSAALVYVMFLGGLFFYQRRLVFRRPAPNYLLYKHNEENSSDIVTAAGRLQGWSIKAGDPSSVCVAIFFGGNAMDVGGCLDILKKISAAEVYTFNYRGYGLSQGEATEKNLFSDALAIYDYVANRHPAANIVLVGYSLGSAVAGYLSIMRKPEYLVLLAPLSSIARIAQDQFTKLVPSLLVRYKFDLSGMAKNINTKTLILIALDDDIIANAHSLETYKNLPCEKSLIKVAGANHNSLFSFDEVFYAIEKFIAGSPR